MSTIGVDLWMPEGGGGLHCHQPVLCVSYFDGDCVWLTLGICVYMCCTLWLQSSHCDIHVVVTGRHVLR